MVAVASGQRPSTGAGLGDASGTGDATGEYRIGVVSSCSECPGAEGNIAATSSPTLHGTDGVVVAIEVEQGAGNIGDRDCRIGSVGLERSGTQGTTTDRGGTSIGVRSREHHDTSACLDDSHGTLIHDNRRCICQRRTNEQVGPISRSCCHIEAESRRRISTDIDPTRDHGCDRIREDIDADIAELEVVRGRRGADAAVLLHQSTIQGEIHGGIRRIAPEKLPAGTDDTTSIHREIGNRIGYVITQSREAVSSQLQRGIGIHRE